MTSNPERLHQAESDNEQQSTLTFYLLIGCIVTIVVVAVVGTLGVYQSKFNGELGNQELFGQFGDYLGGVLNPILGCATVVLLIASLKYQMNELALTRKELKKTTEEAALSRRSVEAQVAHLEKEAKLNEALRILADLRTNISTVANYKSVLSIDVAHEIVDALSNIHTTHEDINRMTATSINDLLYGDLKVFFENNERAREALKKQYKQAIHLSQPSTLIELENLLLQFSTVAIYYNQESHSKWLTLAYLFEAERLLIPFHNAVGSELLQPSIDKLNSLIKSNLHN